MEKDKLPKMSVSTMRVVGPGKPRDLRGWEQQQKKVSPPERTELPPLEPGEIPPPADSSFVEPSKPRFALPKVTMFRVHGNTQDKLTRAQRYIKERALRLRKTPVDDTAIHDKQISSGIGIFQKRRDDASELGNEEKPARSASMWRTASERVSYAARDAKRPRKQVEEKQSASTWGERVLRNCAVVATVVLCVLALKNIDSPITQWATDSIKGMVTAEVNIDDQLGKLQFVQEWMPEAMQVFLSTGEVEWAWPVSGRLSHIYSAEEPWVEIVTQNQNVHAAADGEVLSVTRDQSGDYVVRLRHLYGYETVYANMNGVAVAEGDSITAGAAIGLARPGEVSETIADGTTESKLYLEVRKDGIPTDPMTVFPAARKR